MSLGQIPKSIGLNTQVRPSFKQHNAFFTIKLGFPFQSDSRQILFKLAQWVWRGGGKGGGIRGYASQAEPDHE